jgi:Ni,Fe-hydrogenase III large subunit
MNNDGSDKKDHQYGPRRILEAMHGVSVTDRANYLRALMAELELLANHLGDSAICNDAAFSLMHAHCGALREKVLRTAHIVFGHRLMMDWIVPSGVAAAIGGDQLTAVSDTGRLASR